VVRRAEEPKTGDGLRDLVDDTQFLLEYVHAALASTPAPDNASFSEEVCAELFELANKLKTTALFHAMASSAARGRRFWLANRGYRVPGEVCLGPVARQPLPSARGEFYAFVSLRTTTFSAKSTDRCERNRGRVSGHRKFRS